MIKIITIDNTVEYTPSIDELAKEIWNLNSMQQCELLNCIGKLGKTSDILFQLEYFMTDAKLNLDKVGRWILEGIIERADYLK